MGIAPAFFLLLLLVTAQAADNPQVLFEIRGRVVDAKGVAIPAATVQLVPQAETDAAGGPADEALTDEDGRFSFLNLAPASYRITVSMPGFETLSRGDINPAAESARRLTLTLVDTAKPAARRQSAAASSRAAPSGFPGAREDSPFREIEMGGTDFLDASQALAQADGAGLASRTDGGDLLVISGNPSASVGAFDWSDPGMRERMAEMVQRMGFGGFTIAGPQEPGGAPGEPIRSGEGGPPGLGPGRSGGSLPGGMMPGGPMGGGIGIGRGGMLRQSRINGSAFYNFRNSSLNARPYSLTGREIDQPLEIQNSFGASVGGPLPWGPKPAQQGRQRFQQQAGMWFFSYQGTRNRSPYDVLTTVPTELERSGDFSRSLIRDGSLAGQPVRIYDLTAPVLTPFPDARIPSSRLDQASLGLLRYIPLPNLPGNVQNFTMQRGLPNDSDSVTARINARLSGKDNGFLNYSFRRGDSLSSQIFPGLDTTRTNRSHSLMLGGVHRFQPRTVVNYRASWNRVRTLTSNPFAFARDIAGELGITGVSRDPINYGIPTISFTNYGDLQVSNPSLTVNQTIAVGGGLNKIGSKHTFQFGGDAGWNQRKNHVDPNARGTFDFTGFATSDFDLQGRPLAGTGHDFADFLLGYPYSTSRRYGSGLNYLRNRTVNLFIQDNWRVRANLTVNLGMRYEYIQPFYEKYDRIVSLDIAPGFGAVAQAFPARVGLYSGYFPRSLLYSDRNNFGPRLGLAWKPKAGSRWTWRAGYGLFYNPSVYAHIAGELVGQPPFATNQNLLTSVSAPLTLSDGFPENPSVTILNSYAIDKHYRIGYVQQWSLSVQGQLRRLYVLELGYNGSRGTRLDILRAPNRAPSGSSPAETEGNRIIANAGNFVFQESGANSVLHSGRILVARRFSQGFRVDARYTFSKSVDNASGVGGGPLLVVQDERNIFAERSLSSFDQRHRAQVRFNLDLPLGDRRRWLSKAPKPILGVVSGWNISGDYQYTSGTPLTARILGNVANNSGTGSNYSERADATGLDPSLPRAERTTLRYFNTAAFMLPPPGRFGNAGRYTIPGPSTSLMNASLRKSFRLDEANRRIDFQWQVSNVLNHPNFGGIGTVVNSLNYGRVASVKAMRQMEFSLRFSF
ncbi:MAG: TonB-dependent receptor [Acidobacteria bacterium]|nr:TonB-dependent receptor [Acidobacteriota bacterium]